MNTRVKPNGAVPAPPPGPDPLTALVAARTEWVEAAALALRQRAFVVASWLVGSMGRGTADAYSDIDQVAAVAAHARCCPAPAPAPAPADSPRARRRRDEGRIEGPTLIAEPKHGS